MFTWEILRTYCIFHVLRCCTHFSHIAASPQIWCPDLLNSLWTANLLNISTFLCMEKLVKNFFHLLTLVSSIILALQVYAWILGYADTKYVMFGVGGHKSLKGSMTPGLLPFSELRDGDKQDNCLFLTLSSEMMTSKLTVSFWHWAQRWWQVTVSFWHWAQRWWQVS